MPNAVLAESFLIQEASTEGDGENTWSQRIISGNSRSSGVHAFGSAIKSKKDGKCWVSSSSKAGSLCESDKEQQW